MSLASRAWLHEFSLFNPFLTLSHSYSVLHPSTANIIRYCLDPLHLSSSALFIISFSSSCSRSVFLQIIHITDFFHPPPIFQVCGCCLMMATHPPYFKTNSSHLFLYLSLFSLSRPFSFAVFSSSSLFISLRLMTKFHAVFVRVSHPLLSLSLQLS